MFNERVFGAWSVASACIPRSWKIESTLLDGRKVSSCPVALGNFLGFTLKLVLLLILWAFSFRVGIDFGSFLGPSCGFAIFAGSVAAGVGLGLGVPCDNVCPPHLRFEEAGRRAAAAFSCDLENAGTKRAHECGKLIAGQPHADIGWTAARYCQCLLELVRELSLPQF